MKQEITFVNTPKKIFQDHGTEFDLDKSYPLGILSIGAYIKKYSKIKVNYLDANFYHYLPEKIVSMNKSNIIGLNATFPNAKIVFRIAKLLKKKRKNIKIIVGGSAPTLYPEYFLNKNIDFVTIGESEQTVLELIKMIINKKKEFIKIKGIAFKQKNKSIITEKREKLDLNKIPPIDVKGIPKEIKEKGNEIYLITSRGCSNWCSFCSTPIIWGSGKKNLRTMNIKRIFEEIKNYEKNGFKFKTVHFLDDNFMADWNRIKIFLKQWKKKCKNYNWRCLARIRTLNTEQKIKQIAKNNCISLSVGVESASKKILKQINKKLCLKEVNNFSKWCSKYGLETKGFFMIGFPNETKKDIKKTLNFIKNCKFTKIGINIVTAYPKTIIHNQIYKNKTTIPEFKEIKINSKNKKATKMLEKYSVIPKKSLSKYLTINDLIKFKKLGFELFYKNRGLMEND